MMDIPVGLVETGILPVFSDRRDQCPANFQRGKGPKLAKIFKSNRNAAMLCISTNTVGIVVGRRGNRHDSYGDPGSFVEDSTSVSIQTCSVERSVAFQPDKKSLIGAPSFVVQFARFVFPLLGTWLRHLHYPPQLSRFAVFLVEFTRFPQETHSYKIDHQSSRP
jgi:hypothetical protein